LQVDIIERASDILVDLTCGHLTGSVKVVPIVCPVRLLKAIVNGRNGSVRMLTLIYCSTSANQTKYSTKIGK